MAHDVFHVVAMVLFLAAVATAFIGAIGPLLSDGPKFTSSLRRSILLITGAAAGLGADSLLHHLLK